MYSCLLLQNGLGNVIGGSPSLRASFYVKHQKLQGQEDLATELDKVSVKAACSCSVLRLQLLMDTDASCWNAA